MISWFKLNKNQKNKFDFSVFKQKKKPPSNKTTELVDESYYEEMKDLTALPFESEGKVDSFFKRYELAHLNLKYTLFISLIANFLFFFLHFQTIAEINQVQVKVVRAYGALATAEYPLESVVLFGKDFALVYSLWDQRSIRKMFEKVSRYLSPSLAEKIKDGSSFKIRSIESSNLFQRYEVQEESVYQYANLYYVILQGLLIKGQGSQVEEEIPYYFVVEVLRDDILSKNGYGLVVQGFLEGEDLNEIVSQYSLPEQTLLFP